MCRFGTNGEKIKNVSGYLRLTARHSTECIPIPLSYQNEIGRVLLLANSRNMLYK